MDKKKIDDDVDEQPIPSSTEKTPEKDDSAGLPSSTEKTPEKDDSAGPKKQVRKRRSLSEFPKQEKRRSLGTTAITAFSSVMRRKSKGPKELNEDLSMKVDLTEASSSTVPTSGDSTIHTPTSSGGPHGSGLLSILQEKSDQKLKIRMKEENPLMKLFSKAKKDQDEDEIDTDSSNLDFNSPRQSLSSSDSFDDVSSISHAPMRHHALLSSTSSASTDRRIDDTDTFFSDRRLIMSTSGTISSFDVSDIAMGRSELSDADDAENDDVFADTSVTGKTVAPEEEKHGGPPDGSTNEPPLASSADSRQSILSRVSSIGGADENLLALNITDTSVVSEDTRSDEEKHEGPRGGSGQKDDD